MNNIKQKIINKESTVGVIGLGYVGLPLAMLISNKGFKTYGFDIDENKVKLLKNKKSYISHIPEEKIKELKNFYPTNDFSKLKKCDVIIICVPTPTTESNEPDLSCVINTTKTIAKYLRKGQLIVLESTTYPTTTRDVVKPILEETNLKCGKDFYLAFSPEREDPGRKDFNTETIPKVVGGVDKTSGKIACEFYSQVVKKVVPVSSAEVAESTKMLENTFRAVNIALVNELKILFDRMGIDIWEVIEASKTKPFGFMPFYPGPGWGGHCFEKNQTVIIKDYKEIKCITIEELYNLIYKKINSLKLSTVVSHKNYHRNVKDLEILKPASEIEILSFDIENQKITFQPINYVSKRIADDIISIKTHYNYEIKVTSLHPVFVFDGLTKGISLKFAKDITKNDFLLLPKKLPEVYKNLNYDLIEMLNKLYPELMVKFRVRPINCKWKQYKKIIYSNIVGNKKYDFIRKNYLPLVEYIKLEKYLNIKRDELLILSGNGNSVNSFNAFNAVITIDNDFARLIGYYLSDGCLTEDKKTLKIRFAFNKNEKEYIEDLKNILLKKKIRFSEYEDKKYKTYHIKISSFLLGLFFKHVLNLGKDCYSMKIPQQIFLSTKELRKEILKGVLRADDGVYLNKKNNKIYEHKDNSVEVSFFTSSEILFNQIQLLLREQEILPIIKKRKGLLTIFGKKNIIKLKNIFLGKKEKLLQKYLNKISKQPNYNFVIEDENYFYVKVKDIYKIHTTEKVFSVEVDTTNNLIVNNSILVHNCIPVDPFYLSYIAKKYDFSTRFIELAGQINIRMPEYVVEKVIDGLNKHKKTINGAKILILGLSYKKDIGDPRESPSFKIIELLEQKGAKVDYNDPYIPYMPKMRKFNFSKKSVNLDKKVIKRYNCIIIATDHSCYDYKLIVENAKLVFDARNVVEKFLEKKFGNVIKV